MSADASTVFTAYIIAQERNTTQWVACLIGAPSFLKKDLFFIIKDKENKIHIKCTLFH